MVDKSAIFTSVTERIALRKAADLPTLNLRVEYEHQVALAEEREFREQLPELALKFAADRERIEAQVIADLWSTQGKDYSHTAAGRWAIVHNTAKRFREFLCEVHGIETPPLASVNAVIYGEQIVEELT